MSSVEKPKPILPKKGQIIIEDIQDLVLCKPRLIPLKSFTLEKLEKMQQEAQKSQSQQSPKDE
ncbi:BBSome-interacting protein 1-like [Tribolium castaneum]|uniref:BBSome-interacting protein 1-like n=1 Tax=Tribolium castaneum TaxID=7070 RepID=UPI0001D411CA|nr:BBSome-interacting protein 1-like [Tribolium castaneum]|eukprot:NP_001171930.1 BBSome-interacting protein 1-like [Tribolium castaneum]